MLLAGSWSFVEKAPCKGKRKFDNYCPDHAFLSAYKDFEEA